MMMKIGFIVILIKHTDETINQNGVPTTKNYIKGEVKGFTDQLF